MKRFKKAFGVLFAFALTAGLLWNVGGASAHHHSNSASHTAASCTVKKCPDCGGTVSRGVCKSCHVTVCRHSSSHHSKSGHHC